MSEKTINKFRTLFYTIVTMVILIIACFLVKSENPTDASHLLTINLNTSQKSEFFPPDVVPHPNLPTEPDESRQERRRISNRDYEKFKKQLSHVV
jgi:hypothetical protein